MKTVTVQRFLQMVTVLIYLSLSHTIIKSGCTIVSGESFNFTSNHGIAYSVKDFQSFCFWKVFILVKRDKIQVIL